MVTSSAAKCQQEVLLDGTARKLMKRLRDRAFARGSYPIYFNKPAVKQEADDGVVVERAFHETF
jgi:hypothetical protein